MPSNFSAIATADGNIAPSRFVKASTTDNRVLQAGAGDQIWGISQKGTRRTPLAGLDDGLAAIAGEGLQVFQIAQTAPLELGGTVANGDRLKSDADGKGVTASVGDHYGAIAPQAGVLGQILEVLVEMGTL